MHTRRTTHPSVPRTRKATAVLAAATVIGLAAAGTAVADNVVLDGDVVAVNTQAVSIRGCAGGATAENTATAGIFVSRQGSYENANVYKAGTSTQVRNLTYSVAAGSTVTGPALTLWASSGPAIPAGWKDVPNGTLAGPAPLTITASGSAPGSFSATVGLQVAGVNAGDPTKPEVRSASIPVNVTLEDCAPADTTAPTSSASASTASGPYAFGSWSNQDVTLTLEGSDEDGGSGLAEVRYTTDGSTPTASHGQVYDEGTKPVIGTDGVHTVRFVAVDRAGNVEAPVNEVVVRVDKTLPVVSDASATHPATGTSGENGWWTSDVTVTFSAADGLSGFDGLPDPHTFTRTTTGEGPAVTVASGTVADVAGNPGASVDSAAYKVDKTAPTLTCAGSSTFVLGSTGTVSATVSDAVSGPAAETVSAAADTSTVGSRSVTLTGADVAGLTAAVTCGYSVVYDWSGFFRPIDNLPTLNSVKAGSAVPVKFSLAGDQGLDVMAAGYPRSAITACGSDAAVDAIESTVTAGGSSLSYDPATEQYTYVWKTDKAWAGTCRQLVVMLDDGTTHRASFKLMK